VRINIAGPQIKDINSTWSFYMSDTFSLSKQAS